MKRIMHNLLITLLLTASPLGFAEGKTNLPNAFALRPPAESPPPQTPPPQAPSTQTPIPQPPPNETQVAENSYISVAPISTRYVHPAPPKTRTPSIQVNQSTLVIPETISTLTLPPAPDIRYIDLTSPENAPLRLTETTERNFAKNGAWKKNLFQPNKSDFSLPQQANGRSYAEWNTTAASPQKNHLRALFSEQNDIKPILYEQEINKKPHKSWLPGAFSFKKSENKNLVVDPIYDKKSFLLENNKPETVETLAYIRRAENLGLDYTASASRAFAIYQETFSQGKSLEEAHRKVYNTAHYTKPQFNKLFDRTKEGLNAAGGFIFDGTKVAFEVLVLDDIRAIYNAQGPIEFFGAVASMTPIGKIRKLGKLDDAVDKFEDLKDARKFHPDLKIASNNPHQNIDLNIKIQEKGVGGNGMASLLPNLHNRSEKEALKLLKEYGFSLDGRKRSPRGWERLTTRFDTSEININRITGRITRHPIRQYDPKTGERITGIRLDREGKVRPRSLPHSDYPPEIIRFDFDGDK